MLFNLCPRKARTVHLLRWKRLKGFLKAMGYATPQLLVMEKVLSTPHSSRMFRNAIRKVECVNHACKCYRGALDQENSSYKGSGGLTTKMRKRLVSAAHCAIRMRSQETDRKNAVNMLERDLINGPRHCFGYHDDCSPDFCSHTCDRQRQQGSSEDVDSSSSEAVPLLGMLCVCVCVYVCTTMSYMHA